MIRKSFLFFVFGLITIARLPAVEGMWIPILLEKYNLKEMQQMGFKLTASDIYDVNHASMKDAIVIFGSGCTAELISNEGLLITNHHCGYRQIQSHSSVENDYLTNGFWALNRNQELPNPGLTVSFLEFMKDVTDSVLYKTDNLSGEEKEKQIESNSEKIRKQAVKDGKYTAQIKPLFYGNQYFLYVYKVYKDIRLVGAPPSAIGKFGGDTDNWMWPRHTGDFSVFRIYAGKDNEPADYSPENIPFKPKQFFPVSLKGIQPGDFTMVLGNPGTTMEYIPSQEVEIIMNQRDPDRIKIRDVKLKIIGADMESDTKIRIQYSAKYQNISNAWKKWQGEIKGLQRLDAVNKKVEFENQFRKWALENNEWEKRYKKVFDDFESDYAVYKKYIHASDYYSEIVLRGIGIFQLAAKYDDLVKSVENKQPDKTGTIQKSISNYLNGFFKDFNQPTDEKQFKELLKMLAKDVDVQFLPAGFAESLNKTGYDNLIEKVYRKSVLTDSLKLMALLEKGTEKQILKLRKDPVVEMYNRLKFKYDTDIEPVVKKTTDKITQNMKMYMAGIMEMKIDQPLYPDANLTLRVAYGKVEGYEPADGVKYKYFTTLTGIMQKDNPEIYDYDVPVRLKELYQQKDFGRYSFKDDVPVAFTASNHTTGGNSGSPVINGNGELIGINFDRCWEGTMSDIMYDPDVCRNISLDIRYALFIIDKFAGAGYLLEEMQIME